MQSLAAIVMIAIIIKLIYREFKKNSCRNPAAAKARLLYNRGRYEQAKALIEENIPQEQFDAVIHNLYGCLLLQLKEPEAAIVHFDKAIGLIPGEREDLLNPLFNNKSWAYNELCEYEKSIRFSDISILRDPNDSCSWKNKGNSYMGLGEYAKAIECYNKSFRLNPSDEASCWGMGLAYYKLEEWDDSLVWMNRYAKLDPGDVDVYAYIAALQYHKEDYSGQIETYNKILSINRSLPWVYCMKANAQCFLGYFNEAVINFNKAIKLEPDYAEAYYLKSRVLAYFRHKGEALESLRKAIELDENYRTESWNDDLLNNLKLFSEFREIAPVPLCEEVENQA